MNTDPSVCLFLSAGRCGTQWLATALSQTYGDLAVVTHEPVGPLYGSGRFFRSPTVAEDMLTIPEVRNHLDAVESIIGSKTYIETGWPCYPAIPAFRKRFGDRVKVVQLVRDPIRTALSLSTLGFFQGRDDEWADAMLDPTSPGVVQRGYEARWDEMTPFEKCLFGWTEIHQYGRELAAGDPALIASIVRSEDLFDDAHAVGRLAEGLGLPSRTSLVDAAKKHIDEYRFTTPEAPEWRKVFDHPRTVLLAASFGYTLAAADQTVIEDRYVGPSRDWAIDDVSTGSTDAIAPDSSTDRDASDG